MKISIICAMTINKVIGFENDMPWGKLKIDLQHFKNTTLGKSVVMGRKTIESIGKALPNRRNIVISRNKNLKIENCEIVSSLDEAIKLTENENEIFIIGGAQIYKDALDIADKLYLTIIHDNKLKGDTFFPCYKHLKLHSLKQEYHKCNEENKYSVEFIEHQILK